MAICKDISTVNLHSRFAYLCWVNNTDFRICFQVSDVLKLSEQQQRRRANATLRNGNALVSSEQQQQQRLQLPNLCNLRLLHKFFAVVSQQQQQQQQHTDC